MEFRVFTLKLTFELFLSQLSIAKTKPEIILSFKNEIYSNILSSKAEELYCLTKVLERL